MGIHDTKPQDIKNPAQQNPLNGKNAAALKNNRPGVAQGKFVSPANSQNYLVDNRPTQKKSNNTGLPTQLKTNIENLSGHSLDDVKVHYNSNKPAQLQALAYAQGSDIHIAAGQEKHLPHEAWHVVQQKQGRVKPTLQLKGKVNINDDAGLEKEADIMGDKSIQAFDAGSVNKETPPKQTVNPIIQYKKITIEHSHVSAQWGNQSEIEINDLLFYIRRYKIVNGCARLDEDGDHTTPIEYIITAVEYELENDETSALDKQRLRAILGLLGVDVKPDKNKAPDLPDEKDARFSGKKREHTPENSDSSSDESNEEDDSDEVSNKSEVSSDDDVLSDEEEASDESVSHHSEEDSEVEGGYLAEDDIEPTKASKERHEKAKAQGLFPFNDFGRNIHKSTKYYRNKANSRVFLVDAPEEILDMYGESGQLIKKGQYEKKDKDKGGAQADLRYIDFVNIIKGIFEKILADPKNKKNAALAIKILNEHLYVIHDFKYRVRYKESTKPTAEERKSRKAEIEKCGLEIDVLDALMNEIVEENDPARLSLLINEAIEYFDITFAFGVLDGLHPGRMFGASLDVNHVNYKSLYNDHDYKAVFKRTEEVRKKTNNRFGNEDIEFNEKYLAQSLLDVSGHILEKEYPAEDGSDKESDFLKTQGIGREKAAKIRAIVDAEESESDSDFSDHFEDSDSDGKAAVKRFVPIEDDTIAEFSRKKQAFLNSTAMYSKAMNELILLRQSQLNAKAKPRRTRLMGTVMGQRKKQTATLEFISSEHRTNIADKLNRQLKNIDAMIADAHKLKAGENAVKVTGKKKTETPITNTEELIKAWKGVDFAKGVKLFRGKSKVNVKKGKAKREDNASDIDEVLTQLNALKEKYLQLTFEEFMEEHADGNDYEYNPQQKFGFLNSKTKKPQKKKQRVFGVGGKSVTEKKSPRQAREEWAARYGGVPVYGSGHMNNCLIYAIGLALNKPVSADDADAIRRALIRADFVGVDRKGYLPGYHGVVDMIVQYILAEKFDQGNGLPQVTVRIETAIANIAPVVVGNGGAVVHIFHDGNHFWALGK